MATPKLSFVLALVAALVTGWIFFFERHYETSEQAAREGTHVLPRLRPRDVASLRLERDAWTRATVERIDGATFKRTEPSAAAVDSPPILELLSELEFAQHEAVLPHAGADDSKIVGEGLQRPHLTVTLTMADQRQVEFEIGNETPTADGVYLHLRDSDDVLVVSKALRDRLDKLLDEWTRVGS